MVTMDLSLMDENKGETIGMQNILTHDYESHIYKINEAFEETDVTRNNNLCNPLKTEKNNDLGYNTSSLFQGVIINNENNLKVENSLFNYSSFKKAMDLTIHNRTSDEKKRTIFEDADYFAKNYLYKLLPITFENVDEAIIHTEHNYCHFFLSSESEAEEDCSRTMDYSQIKEKNYKKRKAKLSQSINESKSGNGDSSEERNGDEFDCSTFTQEDTNPGLESESPTTLKCLEEHSFAPQPLDLSAPLVQEAKTDHCLKENQPSIVNNNNIIDEKEDIGEFDSDKENLKSELRCIEVTITRPDEKENYQPCDLFLNDIARLVPRLIEKDCFEIDILDRTCDSYIDTHKHRLYYIISQSTWRLFQSTSERVILTNDQSLGQPVQKTERNERPTFLVFDQFSLAKCLADYCKEIGGCFEYTCVEESKEIVGSNEVQTKKEEEDEVVDNKDSKESVSELVVENEKKEVLEVQSKNEESEIETGNIEEHTPAKDDASLSCTSENSEKNISDMQVSVVPIEAKLEEKQENNQESDKVVNPKKESETLIEITHDKKRKVKREEKIESNEKVVEPKDESESQTLVEISQDKKLEAEREKEKENNEENEKEVKFKEEPECETKVGQSLEEPEDIPNKIFEDESVESHECQKADEKSLQVDDAKADTDKKDSKDVEKGKNKTYKLPKRSKKAQNDRKAHERSKLKTKAFEVKSKKSPKEKDSKVEKDDTTSQIRTRSKSTSETQNDLKNTTSQKRDTPNTNARKGVKRKLPIPRTKSEETPKKRKPTEVPVSESFERKTRSGKILEETKRKMGAGRSVEKKKQTPETIKQTVTENSKRELREKDVKKKLECLPSRRTRSQTKSSTRNTSSKQGENKLEKKVNKVLSKGRKR